MLGGAGTLGKVRGEEELVDGRRRVGRTLEEPRGGFESGSSGGGSSCVQGAWR